MMTCRVLAELLIDFVSNQLAPEQHHSIEQHLECCSQCLSYVESYRIVVDVSRRLPAAQLPPRLEERLQTILRENS